MSLEQYASAGKICYPKIERCPMCHAHTTLIGHGFYHRYALAQRATTVPWMLYLQPAREALPASTASLAILSF